jgi:hypothetical protein
MTERVGSDALPEPFYPWKHLPVMMVDDTLEDGVVIPKGTIVSLITNKTTTQNYGLQLGDPADASSIYVGVDYTGGSITANIDTDYWGYGDQAAGLLIMANGGLPIVPGSGGTLTSYTALDFNRTMDPTGNYITSVAQVGWNRIANIPIGIVSGDVYQDIRGANLNYQIWDKWGVLSRGYIEIPYLDLLHDSGGTLITAMESYTGRLDPEGSWYDPVARVHAFLYNTSTTEQRLLPGSFVKSDHYGKFIPQYVAGVSEERTETTEILTLAADGADVEAPRSVQTVGRLILTDSRFPKSMLETVQTVYGSETPGTETAGLPAPLYFFARDVLLNSGATGYDTAAEVTNTVILNFVQEGVFGMARILLDLG